MNCTQRPAVFDPNSPSTCSKQYSIQVEMRTWSSGQGTEVKDALLKEDAKVSNAPWPNVVLGVEDCQVVPVRRSPWCFQSIACVYSRKPPGAALSCAQVDGTCRRPRLPPTTKSWMKARAQHSQERVGKGRKGQKELDTNWLP